MNNKLVCSLAISKGLVEAGIKLKTEFWWEEIFVEEEGHPDVVLETALVSSRRYESKEDDGVRYYPAPLTDELLEILSDSIREYEFYIAKDERGYLVGYSTDDEYEAHRVLGEDENNKDNNAIPFIDKSLPDALGKMAIWLKKEGVGE